MDQIKIGRFIAEKRKEQNLTQMQLAEALGITDRAVSKWETGRSLPDASLMLDLCGLLRITVNELLCGEELSMEDNKNVAEKTLLEMVKLKEDADKQLLTMEIVIGVLSSVFLLAMVGITSWVMTRIDLPWWVGVLMIGFGFAQFVVAMSFAIMIEQKAGYYACAACGHKYVPTYGQVLMAPHMGRTRHMKCPQCGKKTWQKKVISKE